MSGYLGNPKLVMMSQDSMPVAGYEYSSDPTTTINPVRVPITWINTTTGRLWVCIDNTTDANVWKSQGPITSEKESFTPVFSSWNNVTWTGQKWRIGNILYMEIYGAVTGAPSAGASARMDLTIPDSLSFDTSVITPNGYNNFAWGHGAFQDTSGGYARIAIAAPITGGTFIRFGAYSGDPPVMQTANSTTPFTWENGDRINLRVSVPISGWSVDTIS